MTGRPTAGRERSSFALRFAVGPLFGLFAAGALGSTFAPGCSSGTAVNSNCPIDREGNVTVPRECCPCATPEGCNALFYSKGLTPPPVPEWCCVEYADLPYPLPACADGGVQGLVACPDPCSPQAPDGWEGPEFVYVGPGLGNGPKLTALACPSEAPNMTFEGWPEPIVESPSCPACACAEPLGTCKLPETWTVSSEKCYSGGIETPFDPLPGWDGSCSADDKIPAGQLCGGKPCVRSLTVSAPVIEEQPCEVLTGQVEPGEPPKIVSFAPPPTSMIARACAPSAPWSACQEEPDKLCMPKVGADFRTCVRKAGEEACPEGWPVRHVVYDVVDVETSCSPCACSPPMGGNCVATFDVFTTTTCGGMSAGSFISSADPSQCVDVMTGVELGSKAAAVASYVNGACTPSGGEPAVNMKLDGAMTICCRHEP